MRKRTDKIQSDVRRAGMRSPALVGTYRHPGGDLNLAPCLESVPMSIGEVLRQAGAVLQHLCFRTTAIVSLFHVPEDGASAEIAVVGNEGIFGISLFIVTTRSRAVVRGAGYGYRLKAHLLLQEFNRGGPVCACCGAIRSR